MKETLTQHVTRVSREIDYRRTHPSSRALDLRGLWIKTGQNPDNTAWQKFHEAKIAEWRKQGEGFDRSSPQGFDKLCEEVANLRRKTSY